MTKSSRQRLVFLNHTVIFFTGLFFYLWLRTDPSLGFVAREPFFQLTVRFLSEHCSYPGGMADYIGVFLAQFFTGPIAGAGIITLVLIGLSMATFALIRSTIGNIPVLTLHLFPAALFGAIHSNYYHSISITISLTVAIAMSALYGMAKDRAPSARFFLYIVFSCALYFIAGGAFLMFALLSILIEFRTGRNLVLAFVYAVFAGLIPFVSQEYFFLISLHDAYLYSLPFDSIGYRQPAMVVTAYAYFPAMLSSLLFLTRRSAGSESVSPSGRRPPPPFLSVPTVRIIAPVVLCAVTGLALLASYNRVDNISLSFCRNTREGHWHEILSDFRKTWFNNRVTNYALGQALFYAGLLPVDMFSISQSFGDRGLFLFDDEKSGSREEDAFNFMYRCELFLKLGLVNEAQQWGYEALSVNGESAWALKRIIQTHALNNEIPAALTCLSILERSPLHRQWARRFRQHVLDHSVAASDPLLDMIARSMPSADFIRMSSRQPCLDLEEAVRQHPVNRMTFEYCMASNLLQGNLPRIASVLSHFDAFDYPFVPRLYEEALVMLKNVSYPGLPAVAGRVSRQTLDDYVKLELILKKYAGNLKAAEKEITDNFWNTYWYYCFFVLSSNSRNR